jgi:nucleotide-binding universal stress UspA family protein
VPWVPGAEWVDAYVSNLTLQLEELARELERATEVRVNTHLLEGNPAREVLRLAESVGAELIAAGSHGHGFLERVLVGSTSTRLVRGASCAVLIAPPRALPAELAPAA